MTLNITASTANVGLFSKLAGGAVVKNVITAGSISGKVNNVGGIAGTADGNVTIENCKNTASIKGEKVLVVFLAIVNPAVALLRFLPARIWEV